MASDFQSSEIDYLFKKDAASKVKTDSNSTPISATNESYYTSTLVHSDDVWLQSELLNQGPVGSALPVIQQQINVPMTSIHGVGATQDFPNLVGYSWNSGVKNWIDPSYNLSYSPTFYVGPIGSNPGNSDVYIIASSSDFPFVFDYKSGILTFLNHLPISPYNLASITRGGVPEYQTTYRIWVTGYTYTGLTLASTGPNSILTSGGYSGSAGPTGATGPAGSSSDTGPTGYTGPTGPVAPVYYAEFQIYFPIPAEGSNYYGFYIAKNLAYTPNESIIITNLSNNSLHFEAIVYAYDKNTGIISFGSVTNVMGDFSTSDGIYSINLTGARGTKWFSSNNITDVNYIGRPGDLYLNFKTGNVYVRS